MSTVSLQTKLPATLVNEAAYRQLDASTFEGLAGARRLSYLRIPTLRESLEEAYGRLIESSRAVLMPVWLGATPYAAHWCDWAHQVIQGAERRFRMKEVGDAWTRAASTMPPESQWLLWLEVLSRIFERGPKTRLVAFVPEIDLAGGERLQMSNLRANFISSWTRLMPATLVLPGDATGEHWLRSAGYRDVSSVGAAVVAPSGEDFAEAMAELLQSYSVDSMTARRFAVACVESDDGSTTWDLVPFRSLLTTLDAPAATVGGSATDVLCRRRRTALRLAFMAALHRVKPTLAQQIMSVDGYRFFYGWQEAPLWGKDAGHRLVHALHRPATPLEPILPRFQQEYDAFLFVNDHREEIATAVGLAAPGAAAPVPVRPESLNKMLVGLFTSDIGDFHGNLSDIFDRIESLPTDEASLTERRNALLVLADLASRQDDLSQRCWKTIVSKTQDSNHIEVLAARIMLQNIKSDELEARLKCLTFREAERLSLRYLARNGQVDALRREAAKPASGNLPNDMMRCIFAWCLTSYIKDGSLDRATVARRIEDSFMTIAMETLVRFRRSLKIDEFRPAVSAHAPERVFISYKSGHKASEGATRAAKQIGDALSEEGYDVFMDPKLAGGEEWSQKILAELFSTRIVIGVQSPGYAKSDWCRVERRISRLRQHHHDDRARFIPLLLDGTQEIEDPSEPLGEILLTNPLRTETTQDGAVMDLAALLPSIVHAIELQVGQGKSRRDAQQFHKGL
jgi:TIR domain